MGFRMTAAAAVASVIISAATAIAIVQFWPDGGGEVQTATPGSAPTSISASDSNAQSDGEASLDSACLSAVDIYDQVRPAVVEITSTVSGRSMFTPPAEGEGSGIVIDELGSILTNYHVISGADSLEVTFVDGSVASARVVGTDPSNDLAVIRADVSDQTLTVAPLGDSDDLRVGDPVLAIGNPFNLEGTLTQGIVSALGRTYSPEDGTRPIRDMIQTDAPVNPGNSGGPLVNCQGEVVGINTLLENPTGDSVNVGVAFAVPVNSANASLSEMLAGMTVSHPWLGIAGQEVTPALADDIGLSVESGVYVSYVASGGPAEQAGMRGAFRSENEAARSSVIPSGGDVIIAADGETVGSVEELADYLDREKRPGDTVELSIVRNGEELTIEATLAEWPD